MPNLEKIIEDIEKIKESSERHPMIKYDKYLTYVDLVYNDGYREAINCVLTYLKEQLK